MQDAIDTLPSLISRPPPVRCPPFYRVMGRPRLTDRPALVAGHPLTRGLLTTGTLLEGAAYPFPVFDI